MPIASAKCQGALAGAWSGIGIKTKPLDRACGDTIRKRRARIEARVDEKKKETAESIFCTQIATLRQQVIETAEKVATEEVREFGIALRDSQGRLAVHAVWVRDYTARLVGGLRNWLSGSEVMKIEPLLSWQHDSIVQRGIQACEEILADARSSEQSNGAGAVGETSYETGAAQRTWSPIVQEWEARKAIRGVESDHIERIPETELRAIIGGHLNVPPEAVTDVHIELLAVDLCRHYSRFQIVPAPSDNALTMTESKQLIPVPDRDFWKQREDAFRHHLDLDDRRLSATWNNWENNWDLRGLSPSSESIQAFKSEARDAAKGLASILNDDAWQDWLDWMRNSQDADTGQSLYANIGSRSCTISERERARAVAAGETIPPGELIEFIATEHGGVERRFYWDIQSVTIENIFEKSASECRRLRSVAPFARGNPEETKTRPTDTNSASPHEVEKYANEIFAAGIELRIEEYARKQARALAEASATHNSGAHLPALIQSKAERLRNEILTLADAWVRAGNDYNVPLAKWAEDALERTAAMMTAGIKSALHGEIELYTTRTRRPRSNPGERTKWSAP